MTAKDRSTKTSGNHTRQLLARSSALLLGLYFGATCELVLAGPTGNPVEPLDIRPVGNYAISIQWSDAHDTGIFRFDFLRQICPCDTCAAESADGVTDVS